MTERRSGNSKLVFDKASRTIVSVKTTKEGSENGNDCVSSREIRLIKIADVYGMALMMIRYGAEDPAKIAQDALTKAQTIRESSAVTTQ
jgi:hypothetical protein